MDYLLMAYIFAEGLTTKPQRASSYIPTPENILIQNAV